ncbi:MAG: amino acid adenylation domain-containing protein, partial [Arenicella sp.]|nr:amino acid adenylation domain-containing protein [Arenicella sp.]
CEIWQTLLEVDQVGITDSFFELGGHSLLAMRLISEVRSRFKVEVSVGDVFTTMQLSELAALIESTAQIAELETIDLVDRSAASLSLSYAQERLWFIDQMIGGSAHYNMPLALRVSGLFDVSLAEQALHQLIARHEPLRTVYRQTQEGAVQRIVDDFRFHLSQHDISQSSAAEQFNTIAEHADSDAGLAFDLEHDLMLRAHYLRVSSDSGVLLFNMHHIAADGWSIDILVREFTTVYQSLLSGVEAPLASLPIQYADYAHWQRQQLSNHKLDTQLEYWQTQLAELPAVHSLPLDFARPEHQSFNGAVHSVSADEALLAKLKALALANDMTLFMLLQGAFSLLLARHSKHSDIVIGTPMANRLHKEVDGLIGFFVNTLVLRTDVSQAGTLSDYFAQLKTINVDAQTNQLIPFDYLVERLNPARSTSYSPLFQVMFSMNLDQGRSQISLEGVEFEALDNEEVRAKFELSLNVIESVDGLRLSFEYNTDLFRQETVARLGDHLLKLLHGFVESEQALNHSVSRLPMLSEQETDYLITELNTTESVYPADQCIHELFEARAASNPEAVALVCEGQELSYGELNERSNRLAHYLLEQGVKPDTLVGLCVERSLEMVVGILAILKAGGAYLPLDPSYPEARLSYMLSDSAVDLLLTQSHLVERVPVTEQALVLLDDDGVISSQPSTNLASDELGLTSHHLAYVIYTSGSSGQPKGVMVEHRNVVSLVVNVDYLALSSATVLLQHSSISFDAATFELWAALLNGGRMVIQADGLIDIASLSDFIDANSINTAWMTSGLFDQFATLNNRPLASMKTLLVGGDVVNRDSVERVQSINPTLSIINGYGPTECATFSCSYRINAGDGSVPIGKPLTNRSAFVLDHNRCLAPLGAVGELYVGGAGVARGYLHQAELTQQKFIANPFSQDAGARLYKTGDLVRWLPDGNLQFIGRNDDQVKVRGFRIELDEVRSSLLAVAGVQDAVVVARDEPSRLVAYVMADATSGASVDQSLLLEQCRTHLQLNLPAHTVPSLFMLLSEIPLTANGKVDRKGLPEPDASLGQAEYLAPSTEVEKKLCEIWQQLLGVEQVGVTDNFFELGGHSLLAIKMIPPIREALSNTNNRRQPLRRFSISIVFRYPTITELLAYLYGYHSTGSEHSIGSKYSTSSEHSTGSENPVKINAVSEGPKLFIFHEISGLVSPSFALADAIGDRLPVYAFEAVGNIELAKDCTSIRSLAKKYKADIKTVQPKGPYHLTGWSLGGNIAYEVAAQLLAEGETVGFLGLIDSYKRDSFTAWDVEQFRREVFDRQKQIVKSAELETMLSDFEIGEKIPLINKQDKLTILNRYAQENGNEGELETASYAIELLNAYHALTICTNRHFEKEPLKMVVNLYAATNDDTDMSESWIKFLEQTPSVKKIKSTHQTIIQRPYVDDIADDIVRTLMEKRTRP